MTINHGWNYSRTARVHAEWRWDGYFWTSLCGRRRCEVLEPDPPLESVDCQNCQRGLVKRERKVAV